jgi:hypothetical protein
VLPIHRIPIWTNRRRRRFLRRFREDLGSYFAELRHEAFPYRVVETERARSLRKELEPRVDRCRRVVASAGGPSLRRTAPGERMGEMVRVNLIRAVFELDRYNLEADEVLAVLEDAERRYLAARGRTWLRTVNPLYWLDMVLGLAEMVAFFPARLVGARPRELARTPAGTVLRHLARAVTLLLLLWAVVRLLDGEDHLLRWGREAVRAWS